MQRSTSKSLFFIKIKIKVVPICTFFLMVFLFFPRADRREEVKLLDPELMRGLRDFVGVGNGNLDTCTMATLSFLYIYLSLFGSR